MTGSEDYRPWVLGSQGFLLVAGPQICPSPMGPQEPLGWGGEGKTLHSESSLPLGTSTDLRISYAAEKRAVLSTLANSYLKPRESVFILYRDQLAEARSQQARRARACNRKVDASGNFSFSSCNLEFPRPGCLFSFIRGSNDTGGPVWLVLALTSTHLHQGAK